MTRPEIVVGMTLLNKNNRIYTVVASYESYSIPCVRKWLLLHDAGIHSTIAEETLYNLLENGCWRLLAYPIYDTYSQHCG